MLGIEAEPLRQIPLDHVEVQVYALTGKLESLEHQLFVALHMRGVDPLGTGLEPAAIGDFPETLESALGVAHVEVGDPGFATQLSAHVSVIDHPSQLPWVRLGRPLVRNGDFATADHLGHEEDVVADGSGERGGRDVVSAGPHPGGETLLAEPLYLGEKTWKGLHCGVHTEAADYSRYSRRHDLTEGNFGGLGREAIFAAAPKQVLVRI